LSNNNQGEEKVEPEEAEDVLVEVFEEDEHPIQKVYPEYPLKPAGERIQELGDQAMQNIQNLQPSNVSTEIRICTKIYYIIVAFKKII
jgi:hypothetical protein